MRKILLFIGLWFLLACVHTPKTDDSLEKTQPANITGWVLWFDEQRPGEPGGIMRMLVTQDFLRIDNGNEEEDYLLFNRRTGSLVNVVVDDETVFSLARTIDISNYNKPELSWEVKKDQSFAVTNRKGDKKSEFYQYLVNGQECRSVVSVSDLLPEVVKAMREYHRVLANELYKGLKFQPADDYCYLAFNVFEPGKYLEAGFPVREWDKKGYQRFLKDYQSGIVLPEKLFVLPENYSKYGSE